MILLTILAFIVIFSLLILVHEFGHFYAARKAGVQVEEFGIGLPPRAKAIYTDKQGTVYSINWIPFGGYVRLRGEDNAEPKFLKDKKSFASKSKLARSAVIVAGVFMNFVLAWVLITIGFIVGMRPFLTSQDDVQNALEAGLIKTQQVLYVHDITPGSPLSKTDLKSGDLILKIDGRDVPEADVFSSSVIPNKIVQLTVSRDGKEGELSVMSDSSGKLGMSISTEAEINHVKDLRYPFYTAPYHALKEVGRLSWLTVSMFGHVIATLVGKLAIPEGVSGPVGIAQMTYSQVQQGFMALVQFTALISISLGVINIMPFPALDGGRFLFIIIEAILRRRANARWEAIAHTIGFSLLIALILVITWNDILKFFKG